MISIPLINKQCLTPRNLILILLILFLSIDLISRVLHKGEDGEIERFTDDHTGIEFLVYDDRNYDNMTQREHFVKIGNVVGNAASAAAKAAGSASAIKRTGGALGSLGGASKAIKGADSLGGAANVLKRTDVGGVSGAAKAAKGADAVGGLTGASKAAKGADAVGGVSGASKAAKGAGAPKISASGKVSVPIPSRSVKAVKTLKKFGGKLVGAMKKGGKFAKKNPKLAAAIVAVGGLLAYATVISIRDDKSFDEALGEAAAGFGETAGSLAGSVLGGTAEGVFKGVFGDTPHNVLDGVFGALLNPYGYICLAVLICMCSGGLAFKFL